MEKYVVFVLSVLFSSTVAPPPSVTKQYRNDYEYNQKTDAFYKLHIESERYWKLSDICHAEGAQLMIPSSDYDSMQLHSMFKKFPDLGMYVWVGNDGQTHESAEEEPMIDLNLVESEEVMISSPRCDVMNRRGEIESASCYRQFPFICKVEAKDAPYDQNCDVYGTNYRYYASAGSCYKIPRVPGTWSQAYSECQAEGAHLLVLNSEAEHAAVYNLTHTELNVRGSRAYFFFFAGYRAQKPVGNETPVFKTIFNQTLEEAGYSQWSANEPNNALNSEFCGCIFRNDGKLNDINCEHTFGFICEKEVSSHN